MKWLALYLLASGCVPEEDYVWTTVMKAEAHLDLAQPTAAPVLDIELRVTGNATPHVIVFTFATFDPDAPQWTPLDLGVAGDSVGLAPYAEEPVKLVGVIPRAELEPHCQSSRKLLLMLGFEGEDDIVGPGAPTTLFSVFCD